SSGLCQRKSPAVIQIRGFMQSNQLNDACPQPRWGIEGSLMVFRQIGAPRPALARFHLATVAAPDDATKIASYAHSFIPAQSIDLDLEVLRHKFADDDCFPEQPCRHH